jgi:uncharacterized protein YuzE
VKADFDSEANALWIALRTSPYSRTEEIDDRCRVLLDASERVLGVEVLYLDEPYDDLLRIAAERFDLDAEALIGIARAAVAAPDREVTLRLGARATA